MIERGLSALAPGGILWIDAPGQWRSALVIALRGKGLAIGSPIVLRARGAARAEFSLTSRGLRFVLRNGHVSRRWRLVLAVLERVPRGRAMLFRLLPGVGFAAFRPGTKTLGWLVDRVDFTHDTDIAVTTSWRGERAPFLIFALGTDQTVIAKRGGPGCHAQIAHEAAMLEAARCRSGQGRARGAAANRLQQYRPALLPHRNACPGATDGQLDPRRSPSRSLGDRGSIGRMAEPMEQSDSSARRAHAGAGRAADSFRSPRAGGHDRPRIGLRGVAIRQNRAADRA